MRPLATRWFEHDGPIVLRTAAEVDDMLDALPDAPRWVRIATLWMDEDRDRGRPCASSHLVRIGITGTTGGIFYGDDRPGPDHETGAWFSMGDPDAPGDVEYWGGVEAQYLYPASSVVGLEVIRAAVHEFAETGRRPSCVAWQPWRPPLVESEPAGDTWF